MTEVFSMGGYGGYLWPAWGIALVVLALLIGVSVKSMRARERELSQLEAESPRRRRRGPDAGDNG